MNFILNNTFVLIINLSKLITFTSFFINNSIKFIDFVDKYSHFLFKVFNFGVIFKINSLFFNLDLGWFIFEFIIFNNKFLDSLFKFMNCFFTLFIFNINNFLNNFFLDLIRHLNNLSIRNRLDHFLSFRSNYVRGLGWAINLDLLIRRWAKILDNFSLSDWWFRPNNFLGTLLDCFRSRLSSLLNNYSLRLAGIALKALL